MASGSGERKRKRTRREKGYGQRKLLPGENVLCCEEGLRGSWHAGTVISCQGCSRLIEYRDLLCEDEGSNLEEMILVSAAVEGQARKNPKNYRGLIRPLPPYYDIQIFEMRYGLCVDALVDDAWWEGVVFDHEEGSTKRLIFFPDQGDQQMVMVDHLRLTQDWNETYGHWKPRGGWLLLQVLQAFEEEDALPVSIREIWYDLSTMVSFREKIGLWMFGSLSVWEQLVSGLIRELLSVVHVLSEVSYDQPVDAPTYSGNDEIPSDDVPRQVGSQIQSDTAGILSGPVRILDKVQCSQLLTPDDCFVQGNGNSSEWNHDKQNNVLETSDVEDVQNDKSGIPSSFVYHEEVVFTHGSHKKRRCRDMQHQVKASIPTVAQKFKKSKFDSINEVSPDGNHHRDMVKAFEPCKVTEPRDMKYEEANNNLPSDALCIKVISPFSHQNNKEEDTGNRTGQTSWQSLYAEAERCPEAVALYAFRSADRDSQVKPLKVAEKVKKHLFALGWKIEYRRDRLLRVRFVSPEGKNYYNLRKACIDVLKRELEGDQSCKQGRKSFGNCSGFSKPDSKTGNVCPELASLMQNFLEHPSIMGTERMSDHSGHCFRQFQTNIGMKTERKLERLRPFSKLADNSHSLLDSVRMKLHPDEFHESKQPDSSVSGKENLELIVSENVPTYKHIEPEYRPQAISNYKRYIESSREKGIEKLPNVDIELMKLNVQKHLLYMGWIFAERRRKLRFASPGGEIFHSLYTACEAYLEKEENMGKTYGSSLQGTNVSQNSWCASIGNKINDSKEVSLLCKNQCFSTSMDPDEFQKSDEVSNNGTENRSILVFSSPECGEGFGNSCLEKLQKSKTGIKISSLLPLKVVGCRRLLEHYCSQKSKKRKVQDLRSKGYEAGRIFLQPEQQQLSERCQFVPVTSPTQKVVEATWSMLIENRIVLARQKVRYISKRDGHVLMEGHITHDGIKCRCCRKLHSLTGFEAHAGSDKCKPGANTFLLDGRSLLQCHLQMVYGKDLINFPHPRLKHVYAHSQSDSVCSVCQYGGTLMLCDHCPSAFHVGCVGLKDLPKGKWFCPSCRCGICASSAFSSAEQFSAKTMLYCDQCERKYHVGCLRRRGTNLKHCPTGNWFCSKKCSEIFLHLRNLLGKSNPTTKEGFSWILLRSKTETDANLNQIDFATVSRNCRKLHIAQKLLHECFVSIIEPRTQSDLLADLLMNKESELNRLNFWGFYTMLLVRGDEIISMATFRVYGEKVAEMPLVGTRAKYRRQGMCHIILDELEKLLSALGVERLCIPAVQTLLETWMSSFGFTKMSNYERLNLLEYTLLNFQDTIMCQKPLRTAPEVTDENKGKCHQHQDSPSKNLD
ncbi:unnamed protein product [Musa hybrid cultivar]